MMAIGRDVHQHQTTVARLDTETGEVEPPYAVLTAELVTLLAGAEGPRGVFRCVATLGRTFRRWIWPRPGLTALWRPIRIPSAACYRIVPRPPTGLSCPAHTTPEGGSRPGL